MLVLSRKEKESLIIDGTIRVTVLEVRGGRIRLGIDAPSTVSVVRTELAVWRRPRPRPDPNATPG